MIVLDTSALMAVVNQEPEGDGFLELMIREQAAVSTVTLFELRMVVWGRFRLSGMEKLDSLLLAVDPSIVPFDATQGAEAFGAFKRYGKGFDPKARLNFGDCVSYALAKTLNAPLLFKGDDFAETDVRSAFEAR